MFYFAYKLHKSLCMYYRTQFTWSKRLQKALNRSACKRGHEPQLTTLRRKHKGECPKWAKNCNNKNYITYYVHIISK